MSVKGWGELADARDRHSLALDVNHEAAKAWAFPVPRRVVSHLDPVPPSVISPEPRHCPRARVLEYALGASNQDEARMTLYPRMPGNSTLKPREKVRPAPCETLAPRRA